MVIFMGITFSLSIHVYIVFYMLMCIQKVRERDSLTLLGNFTQEENKMSLSNVSTAKAKLSPLSSTQK